MATLVDVARMAGVSVSTVSHVVNGTRPVNDATRQRVEEAIAAVDYRQDTVARALRRSRTDSVGLVVSDVSQPVFGEMVRGFEQEATAAGLTVLLANSGENAAHESRAVRTLTDRRVDGLVVAPVAHSLLAELEAISQRGTPVVVMDRLGSTNIDQVGVYNTEPTMDLVLHMVEHGHRRIGLVAGDLSVATMFERHLGYQKALSEAGIDYDPALVVTGSGMAEQTSLDMRDLLASAGRPTAVVAASTETAAGALRAAYALGMQCPTDFAFASFDGFAYPDLFRPTLTAVTQPARQVGATALKLLLSRLNGPDPGPFVTVRLHPSVDYRQSCGCQS